MRPAWRAGAAAPPLLFQKIVEQLGQSRTGQRDALVGDFGSLGSIRRRESERTVSRSDRLPIHERLGNPEALLNPFVRVGNVGLGAVGLIEPVGRLDGREHTGVEASRV